jgi:hypothetical protein
MIRRGSRWSDVGGRANCAREGHAMKYLKFIRSDAENIHKGRLSGFYCQLAYSTDHAAKDQAMDGVESIPV